MWVVLALQLFLFSHPVTNATAIQVHQNVVVTVTFSETLPAQVCVSKHTTDDQSFTQPVGAHCWAPTSAVGEFDTWEHTDINDWNFVVVVTYSDRPAEVFYLTTINES